MKQALLNLYRRFDLVQRTRSFRLIASVLVLLLCGGIFGSLLSTSYSTDRQRTALIEALTDQNVQRDDEHAVSLSQTGTVTVNGRTYGGESYLRNIDMVLDEQGNIRSPIALAERLLDEARPAWAPRWMLEQPRTTWLLAGLTTVWLLLIIWLDLTLPFLLTIAGTAVPVAASWLAGSDQVMLAFAGIGLLTFTYLLLTRLVLVVYARPRQILAVAHTVIKEASRSRISLVFIVLLLIILPLLPVWLDSEAPLRYQIQTFISRSMGATFFLAAMMTLFLACATVAFEIRDRQIWQLMTKPLARANYLLGKWLGVVTVNLILLTVSGISTFTFVQYLRARPVAPGMEGQLDALAVRTEVLTARMQRLPDYDTLDGTQLSNRVEQVVARDPDLSQLEEVPLSTIRKIRADLQEAFLLGQRTIPPQFYREYVFHGLDRPRRENEPVTLRYRFHILRSDEHETYQAIFWFNDDRNVAVRRNYVPTMSHVLTIPPQLIQEDGTLKISVFNPFVPSPEMQGLGAINFELEDFEVLYKVGDFEANFVRAILINWVKLAFLAMLGISASTFLSFSVACLLSFTIFVAGSMGPYLADSLSQWYPPLTSQMDWGNFALVLRWAFQWFIKIIAESLVWSLSGFGEISATRRLVEGKFISWFEVIVGFFKLVVIWSGVALGVGLLVIKNRQLAIYSGQG